MKTTIADIAKAIVIANDIVMNCSPIHREYYYNINNKPRLIMKNKGIRIHPKEVNFEVSETDRKTIDAIVERAKRMWPAVDATSLSMDLVATHNHVRKLRLEDLLTASDLDFAHDVSGIVCYLDREKLNMKHCFEPRFAAREDK